MNSSPQANAAMRAAVWHGRHDIRVEDVPLPAEPPPGWVQIRVHWCGICGSDLHEYLAGPVFIPVEAPHPLTGLKDQCILGHEFSGEIVRLGNGVTGFAVGQAVAADACQHCGTCYYCRHGLYNICENLAFTGLMNNGAFAEYVNVPANLLYALPAGSPSEAGALIEPLAVGMHAVKKAGSLLGQNVVVVGAGTIGLSTIMCARRRRGTGDRPGDVLGAQGQGPGGRRQPGARPLAVRRPRRNPRPHRRAWRRRQLRMHRQQAHRQAGHRCHPQGRQMRACGNLRGAQ